MSDRVEYRTFYALRDGDKVVFGSLAGGGEPDQVALVVSFQGDDLVLEPDWLAEQEEDAGYHRAWRHFLLRTIGLPLSVARRLFVVLPPVYALASDEALTEYVQWIAEYRIRVAGIGLKTAESLREHLVEKGLLEVEAIDNP